MNILFLIFNLVVLSFLRVNNKIIIFIIFLLLSLGSKYGQVISGGDTSHFYFKIFEGKILPGEIGYYYFVTLINWLSGDRPYIGFYIENLIVSFLYVILAVNFYSILKGISNYKIPNYGIFLFNFLILTIALEYYFIGARNFFANILFLIGIVMFLKNKIKVAILYFILSSTFHIIGIIMLVNGLLTLILFRIFSFKNNMQILKSKFINWKFRYFLLLPNILMLLFLVIVIFFIRDNFVQFTQLFKFMPLVYQKFRSYTGETTNFDNVIQLTSYMRFLIYFLIFYYIFSTPLRKKGVEIKSRVNVILKMKLISIASMSSLLFFLLLNFYNIIPYLTLTRIYATFQSIALILLLLHAHSERSNKSYFLLFILISIWVTSLITNILRYNDMNSIQNFLLFSYPSIIS
jgi:hypothetical protein